MKVGVYDIINNPLPELHLLKEITVYKKDLEYNEDIVNMLNRELMFDKLDSEYTLALSLTYGLIPRGIIQLSMGSNTKANKNIRGLGIGLLLTGAEQFLCFHNHPGGNKNISLADKSLTIEYDDLGNSIGVEFINHIMVTKGCYKICK